MSTVFDKLTEEQIGDAERDLAARKRELEHAKWDAELVGRYFRIIRTPPVNSRFPFFHPRPRFVENDYVTLERSLGACSSRDFVYADVVYLHIKQRNDNELTCSGFEVSHANRKEPYLKIQPVFYSICDFRNGLNSWDHRTGPTKHFDEISKEEYEAALTKAVTSFTNRSNDK